MPYTLRAVRAATVNPKRLTVTRRDLRIEPAPVRARHRPVERKIRRLSLSREDRIATIRGCRHYREFDSEQLAKLPDELIEVAHQHAIEDRSGYSPPDVSINSAIHDVLAGRELPRCYGLSVLRKG